MKLRTQLLPITLCVLIGGFATAPVDASCLAGTCILAWEDNFDGTSVDTSKWESMIGAGCSYNLCGWGNKNKVCVPNQVLIPVRYPGRVHAPRFLLPAQAAFPPEEVCSSQPPGGGRVAALC